MDLFPRTSGAADIQMDVQVIIQYFKDHGANNIRLSTKETNFNALSIYRKAGFRDTGEMNEEEIVLQLDL